MAETSTPTIVEEITHVRTGPFTINYHSDDFTGGLLNVELIEAPTRDNSATYLTHVTMGIVANANKVLVDANLTLIDGVGSEVFGPIQFCDSGTTIFSKDWKKPLKITDEKALDLKGSCATTGYQAACFVYIEYCTGDNPIS
jgi:hypothetical protein